MSYRVSDLLKKKKESLENSVNKLLMLLPSLVQSS